MAESTTIADLKPYPDYRTPEQDWLGAVPTHWDVRRVKLLLREVDSRSATGKEQLLRVSQYTGVTERKSKEGSDAPDTRAASLVGYKRVAVDDLAVNIMLAWNGSLGVSRYVGIVSPAYCVYRLNESVVPWYVHELLRLPLYKGRIKAVSTGVVESRLRLYSDDLGTIEALVPPPDEQAAIVRFLDHADRKIDRYIRAKQRLIALLNEQKQAIIQRAVTRGLDPNVPLKPSGIASIGDIPTRWQALQVRRVVSFVTSGSRGWASYYSEAGDVFIQSGNLGRSMSLDFSYTQHVRPPPGAEGERTRVRCGDVLICITGALTGNVVHVAQDLPGPSFVNQHVALVRPRKDIVLPRFLAYALSSRSGQSQFKTSEYGGTKQGLGLGEVKGTCIPLPSLSGQSAIVTHLDGKLAQLHGSVSHLENEIALMQEYRTRLTADVVTGKLDVREAAAKLPDLPMGSDPEADGDALEAENEIDPPLEEAGK